MELFASMWWSFGGRKWDRIQMEWRSLRVLRSGLLGGTDPQPAGPGHFGTGGVIAYWLGEQICLFPHLTVPHQGKYVV